MSQASSSHPHEYPITISLRKFSHATTNSPQAKPYWVHLHTRDNLFMVFDYLNVFEGAGTFTKTVLKVIRDGEKLEEVNLDELAWRTRLEEEMAQNASILDANRHVLVILRKPLMSLRYPMPNGQVRRIQMNFLLDSGYDLAMKTLASSSLPIRDKSHQQLDSTSQVDPLQSMLIPKDRAGSVATSSTGTSLTPRAYHIGGLHSQHLPNSMLSGGYPPSHGIGDSQLPFNSKAISDMSFVQPRAYALNTSQDSLLIGWESATYRPFSHQDSQSQAMVQQLPVSAERSGSAHQLIPGFGHDVGQSQHHVQIQSSAETLSQMLPPKRKLPFADPPINDSRMTIGSVHVESATGAGVGSTSPISSTKKMPASSKPKAVQKNPRKPAVKPKAAPKERKEKSATAKKTLAELKKKATQPKTVAKAPNVSTMAREEPPAIMSMNSSGRSDSRLEAESVSTPVKLAVSMETFLDACQTCLVPLSGVPCCGRIINSKAELADLMNQPLEERRADLKEIVIALVNDENFKKLCDDMGIIWEEVGPNPHIGA